jgi:hypothetical protein
LIFTSPLLEWKEIKTTLRAVNFPKHTMDSSGSFIRTILLASTGGAIIGWFLNQISGWWRIRRDDKRTLNQVLFNLLEIHHLLNRFDIDESVDQIIDRLIEKLTLTIAIEERNQVKEIIKVALHSFLLKITTDELKAVESKYQAAIDQLAKISPVRAFYLSDKTKILENINLLEKWVDHAAENDTSGQIDTDQAKKMLIGATKPEIMDDSLKDFRKHITAIAWQINPLVWLKIKRLLNKRTLNTSDLEEKIETIIELIKQGSNLNK